MVIETFPVVLLIGGTANIFLSGKVNISSGESDILMKYTIIYAVSTCE